MFEYVNQGNAQIKVFGVGGGGSNAVECMIQDSMGLENITFICANTDAQALQSSSAPIKIQLGSTITAGLGAGANPDVGERSALEDQDRIREVLAGADMVFITAGMGGGTGTGAAPVVAQIAKELDILTVAVVTKPLHIEGIPRMRSAERGIEALRQYVDSLIEIPNQRLLGQSARGMGLSQTFAIANKILIDAVRGITEIINDNGIINVDFADVRTIMSNQGSPNALMGTGIGRGEQRAISAAAAAISSPLLDHDITYAQSVLMNFTGGHSMSLSEITEAAETITQEIHGSPTVILGAVVNDHPDFDDESIKVTVIATGFTEQPGANIETTHSREKYGSRGREQRRPTSLTPRSATPERSRAPKPVYQDRPTYSATSIGSVPPMHKDSSSSSSDEHPSWEVNELAHDDLAPPVPATPELTPVAEKPRALDRFSSASLSPAVSPVPQDAQRGGGRAYDRPSYGRPQQSLGDTYQAQGEAPRPSRLSRARYEQSRPSGARRRSGLGSLSPVTPLDQPDDAWGSNESLEPRKAYQKRRN